MAEAQDNETTWDQVEAILRRSQSLSIAGQFAAAVMHEINNPLEAASNLAYLIRAEAENPAKVRAYTGLLEEQLSHVLRIAQQTLSFYRASNGQKPIDLVGVAEAALRVHEHKLGAKELRLIKSFPKVATVKAHPGELLQVVSNLVANALDALETNGVLSIRIRKCATDVHMTIADNGHGIPEAALPRLFEPFFSTKQGYGTGIGLALSKSIIERHRGNIRLRTCVRPGRRGTAFRISLPLHTESSATAA